MPGTEFSHLPRMDENTKLCSELKLWVLGLHCGNMSNTYSRAEVFYKEPSLSTYMHKKIKEKRGVGEKTTKKAFLGPCKLNIRCKQLYKLLSR